MSASTPSFILNAIGDDYEELPTGNYLFVRVTLLSPTLKPSLRSSPWMRGAPQEGVLPAHLADQRSDLGRNDGSSGLAAARLPGPEQAKPGTMLKTSPEG